MNTRRPTPKSTANVIRKLADRVAAGTIVVHGISVDPINDNPAFPSVHDSWKWTIEFSRVRRRGRP